LTKAPVQFASLPGGGQEHGLTMAGLKEWIKGNISKELTGKSDIATPKEETTEMINSVKRK